MLPVFAEHFGLPCSNREGWLSGSFSRIMSEPSGLTMGVACPTQGKLKNCREEVDGAVFYGFTENLDTPEIYDPSLEERFKEIVEDFQPDLVHIFGTEFPHTLAMTIAYGRPEHTLIGIQGLCRSIADVYMADLPYPVQKRATLRDRLRRDSLIQQRRKFELRAQTEAKALRRTGHITGRTAFDRKETAEINPDAVYHAMNETLRSEFYTGTWSPEHIERHSIFLSQGDYPLKGFHYMLKAMPLILEKFPDAHLYVAGNSIIGPVGGAISERGRVPLPLRITSYGKYLLRLIRRLGLQGHVTMLGRLTAQEMKEQYLRSNVFVCASIMENSPNSMCEAMLLGVPVVAAKVGGVPDLISDGEEGILFPGGKVDELAEGVETVFYDDELAMTLGGYARRRAKQVHNPDTNFKRLIGIYRSMMTQ